MKNIQLNYNLLRTTNDERRATKRAFTLIEVLIVIMLLAVLMGVAGHLSLVCLRAWDAGRTRTGIREDINYATERIVRDLKEMANGSLSQYNSIAHTIQFTEVGANTFALYLYNTADSSFDSSYSESLYNLRKADITAGDDPASGEGVLLLRDLVSPDTAEPAVDLTISSNEVTLDIVVQRDDETVSIRTKIRPRNL